MRVNGVKNDVFIFGFFFATYVHSVKMVSYQSLSLSSRFGFGFGLDSGADQELASSFVFLVCKW